MTIELFRQWSRPRVTLRVFGGGRGAPLKGVLDREGLEAHLFYPDKGPIFRIWLRIVAGRFDV